jgi:hypothetical protein
MSRFSMEIPTLSDTLYDLPVTMTTVEHSKAKLAKLRRHDRRKFQGVVRVVWNDSRGLPRSLPAQCLDLSAEGARLETDVPVPARASIALLSARYGALGNASVRYCTRDGLKYSVGVEFTTPLSLAGPGRKRCLDDAPGQA